MKQSHTAARQKKFSALIVVVGVLLHDVCKLQPPKLYKNVQELFAKQGNFFLQKVEK